MAGKNKSQYVNLNILSALLFVLQDPEEFFLFVCLVGFLTKKSIHNLRQQQQNKKGKCLSKSQLWKQVFLYSSVLKPSQSTSPKGQT